MVLSVDAHYDDDAEMRSSDGYSPRALYIWSPSFDISNIIKMPIVAARDPSKLEGPFPEAENPVSFEVPVKRKVGFPSSAQNRFEKTLAVL